MRAIHSIKISTVTIFGYFGDIGYGLLSSTVTIFGYFGDIDYGLLSSKLLPWFFSLRTFRWYSNKKAEKMGNALLLGIIK